MFQWTVNTLRKYVFCIVNDIVSYWSYIALSLWTSFEAYYKWNRMRCRLRRLPGSALRSTESCMWDKQEQVVRLINSAKRDYFRTTIASATQSDAYRVINDLLTSTTTQSLPSHDSGTGAGQPLCAFLPLQGDCYPHRSGRHAAATAASAGGTTPCCGAHSWWLLHCDICRSAQASPGLCKRVVLAGPGTDPSAEGVGSAGLCPTAHAACRQWVFGVVSSACLP